jgi:hypothetical protein
LSCEFIVVVHGKLVDYYPRVVTACERERPNECVMLSRIDGEYHGSHCAATKRNYEYEHLVGVRGKDLGNLRHQHVPCKGVRGKTLVF